MLQPDAELYPQRVQQLADTAPLPGEALLNDLAEPAFHIPPGLETLHRKISDTLGLPVHVSGSGASMFVLADSRDHALAIRQTVGSLGLAAVATAALK